MWVSVDVNFDTTRVHGKRYEFGDPEPSDPAYAHSFAGYGGKEGLVYRTNQSDKVVVERHWKLMPFAGGDNTSAGSHVLVAFNPVVDAEYTTLRENGQAVKMSAKTYAHDYNGNVTKVKEYDWFDTGWGRRRRRRPTTSRRGS